VHDGNDFFSLNVSIPSILGPRNARLNETGIIFSIREGDSMIIGTAGVNDELGIAPGWMMAVSLEDGKEGTKLWENTWTPPSSAGRTQALTFGASASGFQGVYPEYGVFMYRHQRTQKYYAFSLDTFKQIWESEPETQFGYYGTSQNVYDGIFYSYGYGGVIYAYNITTGERLFEYAATSEGFESTYGGNYPIGIVIIADGKLYTVTGEHSPTQPLYRGHNLRCLNATTGDEIWKIQGWFGGMSPTSSNILMADGILVGLNFFDNQLYAFGRGPSATTVTASPKVSVHGSKVVIEGTVTDQSPVGRRDISGSVQVPLKGTPAISDEDMATWMEYLFMQQACPTDAKGVDVVLTVLDPNNNVYEIGRTTSDYTGTFGFEFEPLVPGMYQVTATFEGSNAYGPSSATTYLTVEEAPAATAPPTPEPQGVADAYFVPAIAGIIVAIVVIGIVIILMLRKR
jgi:outer membrane protein assembly factor BamB